MRNSRSEEKNVRNTCLFGGWNTTYSMIYVEYEWNTCVIQAAGRSFGIRGILIPHVGWEGASVRVEVRENGPNQKNTPLRP